MQIRNAELVATQRMEAAEKRKNEEKERRLAQVVGMGLSASLSLSEDLPHGARGAHRCAWVAWVA